MINPMINRRSLITGLIPFIAAPAIVRVSSIMPVKSMIEYPVPLPPGEYMGTVEMQVYNKRDVLYTWKLYSHAQNYGMRTEDFIRNCVTHTKD